jgi:glyoxylase-like metal-dependent hydrolase (beta-lactamase superfamily II)
MWEIKTLDLGLVLLNESRMLYGSEPGKLMHAPIQGWLLIGPKHNVVIDTGFRHPDILKRLGDRAQGVETPVQRVKEQLALHGLKPADVRYVLHTHLHIDHAGQTDVFPDTTTAVVNRRELEYAASGLSGPSYPPEDIKHMIDRMHTPGALRLLDLELTGGEDVLDGIHCVAAGGHTEGSMVITVDTVDGPAVFCGDLIYSVKHQLQMPRILDFDPAVSANAVVSRRAEKAALKRLLATAPRFKLFPSHDMPAIIDRGRVESEVEGEGCGANGCWCRMTQAGYREEDPSRDQAAHA